MDRLRIAPGIRLRAENFGGLVFDKRAGNILEVDKEAFGFLRKLEDRGISQSEYCSNPDFRKFIRQLRELRVLDDTGSSVLPNEVSDEHTKTALQHSHSWLSAPETVHWAVTYRCGMKCPDCYAARFAFPGVEFNNREGKEMIDKIAEWNVFQLAIGGGEPLEHEDISALVAYASSCGLVVHLTTGRQYVSPDTLVDFAGNLTTLQLGINSNLLLNYPQEYLRNLSNLIRTASDSGIKTGANICLNKSVLKNFRIIIDKLINTGLERFTLLRYKPPASISRWHEQLPEIKQLLGLRTELEKIVKLYPGINLRIDCALSFFQHDLLPGAAQWHGIIGCAAGTRIVSVGPDGSVYPCSQLVAPEFCAGNLFSGNAKSIWNDSPVMRNYRAFREANTFKNSMCGTCESKYFCGGCRVFSVDAIGGDPGCPVHYSAKKDIPENLSPEYDAYPNWISHSKSQGEMKHENHLVT